MSGYKLELVKNDIASNKKVMVLMRGCPGSGKTYLARELISSLEGDLDPSDFILSTDDYFTKDGVYDFEVHELQSAHNSTQKRCRENAARGLSPIIIDNTNTALWHMKPYAATALDFGYSIVIMEPNTHWFNNVSELAERNHHGVPEYRIRNMLKNYERDISVEQLIMSLKS